MPLQLFALLVLYQTLNTFVHLAVYATLRAAFGIGGPSAALAFILLSFTFSTAAFLAFRFSNRFVSLYYRLSAYWLGLVNFLFAGGFVFFILETIFYFLNIYIPPAVIGGFTFGAFTLLYLYATWSSGRSIITKIKVALPGAPAEWKGKRAVFVSDIHLGDVRGERFAAKMADKIKELSPEIVFIGGDLYDGEKCDPEELPDPLQKLHVPKGIYFVSGNHEYRLKNVEGAFAAIKDLGIRRLHNEKVDLGGVDLVGVDYKSTHHRGDFEKVLKDIQIDRTRPTILLKHVPSHLDVADDAGITVGFFGHTHRGQIFPLSYLTRRIYKGFDYGFKNLNKMEVYTSSGVGTWGPPLRLGAKSEIVLVEFE